MRVVVVRFGALGDVVLSSGAIETISQSDASIKIALVTKANYAPLFAEDPRLDTVFSFDGQTLSGLSEMISRWSPTHILDLHGSLRSRLLSMRLNLPTVRRVGRSLKNSLGVRFGLLKHRPRATSEARDFLAVQRLLKNSNDRLAFRRRPRLHVIGHSLGFDCSEPYIVLSPGARWQTKMWPASSYKNLIPKLNELGYRTVLNGSEAEVGLCRQIADGSSAINLAGRLPIATLPNLMRHASLSISGDTGPMHVARAVGCPVIGLFGSTSTKLFERGPDIFLSSQRSCSPCSLYGRKRCPKGQLQCMTDMKVEAVYRQACTILSRAESGDAKRVTPLDPTVVPLTHLKRSPNSPKISTRRVD